MVSIFRETSRILFHRDNLNKGRHLSTPTQSKGIKLASIFEKITGRTTTIRVLNQDVLVNTASLNKFLARNVINQSKYSQRKFKLKFKDHFSNLQFTLTGSTYTHQELINIILCASNDVGSNEKAQQIDRIIISSSMLKLSQQAKQLNTIVNRLIIEELIQIIGSCKTVIKHNQELTLYNHNFEGQYTQAFLKLAKSVSFEKIVLHPYLDDHVKRFIELFCLVKEELSLKVKLLNAASQLLKLQDEAS